MELTSKELILNDLKKSTQDIHSILENIPDNIFLFKKGKEWSVADCIEHLILLETLLFKVIKGKTEKTIRNHQEKIPQIKEIFSDYEKKLNAPEPIAPGSLSKELQTLKKSFLDGRISISKSISTEDLKETCLEFTHRFFGPLTREEWIYFIIFHTERHLMQINKQILKAKEINKNASK